MTSVICIAAEKYQQEYSIPLASIHVPSGAPQFMFPICFYYQLKTLPLWYQSMNYFSHSIRNALNNFYSLIVFKLTEIAWLACWCSGSLKHSSFSHSAFLLLLNAKPLVMNSLLVVFKRYWLVWAAKMYTLSLSVDTFRILLTFDVL